MITRGGIAAAGLGGLWVIYRAAVYYQSVDEMAFGLTLVMGVALIVGLIELMFRAGQMARLSSGVAALPESPKSLEDVNPELRAVLRSHLEHDPMPPRAPVFTPYLIGLLVMLGLLGTFLGLFETLRGAREALSASADIDTLRAGLSQPMGGLMRSFGTSAAGVASSAMLGLGAVLVRRASRRVDVLVHRVCAGKLTHLSAGRRQLGALEALAEQGKAFPGAAVALADAAKALGRLEEIQREADERAAERAAMLADKLSDRVQEGLADAAAKLDALRDDHEKAQTELRSDHEAAMARIDERLAQLAERWEQAHANAAEKNAASLEQVSERLQALRDAAADQDQALRGRHEEAAAALRDAATAVGNTLEERLGALAERAEVVAQRWEESQGAAADAQAKALRDAAVQVHDAAKEELREAAEAAAKATAPVLEAALGRTENQAAEHLASLREMLAGELAQQANRDQERAESLGEVAQRVEEELVKATSVVRERLAANVEADAAQQKRAEELLVHLEAATGRVADAAGRQVEALERFVEANNERVQEQEERTQQRLEALLGRIGEGVRSQGQRLASLETALVERQERSASALADELKKQAEAIGDSLSNTAGLVNEAAALVKGGGAELVAAVEMFVGAVDQHNAASQRWMDGLGMVDQKVEDAGTEAAVDILGQYLARTHELFDQQLGFQQELVERLQGISGGEEAPFAEFAMTNEDEGAPA